MAPARNVVLICDAQSIDARAFLSRMKREDRLVRIEPGDKSLIICQGRRSRTAYLSPIATRTLARRFAAQHERLPLPAATGYLARRPAHPAGLGTHTGGIK